MKNRLDQNQQEKIRERYHDHPLLCACQESFENFQAGMRYLMFSPIEVFVESVEVIDNLLEEGTDKEAYIQGLWKELLIRYKLWPLIHSGAVDDNEYETAVCSVLYTVAIVLSRHNDCYYSVQIKDAILAEIEKHTSIVKQEEDKVIVSLSKYADKLELWLETYADSEKYLSDDIYCIAHNRNPYNSQKVIHKKDKKKFDSDTSRETFAYWPDGMSETERNIRLKMAFSRMRGTLIDRETHYDTFEAFLSGKPLDIKIVWVGINSQLRELFSQLVTKKKLLRKPTGGLNQILTTRFKKADGTLFTPNEIKNAGSDGDMSAVNDVVAYLTPSTVAMDDLELQLRNLLTEEQERADMRGKKDNKHQKHIPNGTNISSKPNQNTRKNYKKS